MLDQAHRDASNGLSALQLSTIDGPDGPVAVDPEWAQQLAVDVSRLALRLVQGLRAAVAVADDIGGLGQTLLLGQISGQLTAAEEVAGD